MKLKCILHTSSSSLVLVALSLIPASFFLRPVCRSIRFVGPAVLSGGVPQAAGAPDAASLPAPELIDFQWRLSVPGVSPVVLSFNMDFVFFVILFCFFFVSLGILGKDAKIQKQLTLQEHNEMAPQAAQVKFSSFQHTSQQVQAWQLLFCLSTVPVVATNQLFFCVVFLVADSKHFLACTPFIPPSACAIHSR